MYLELYTGLYAQYVIGIGAGLLALIVRYIVEVKRGKKRLFKVPLILTTVLVILYSCINYSFNTDGFYSGMNFIYMFYLVYFVFIYHREIKISRCFNYLLIGMLVTAGLSALACLFDNFLIKVSHFDGVYPRVNLFTMHVNFLSMLCLFEIGYSIYSLFHKKRHWVLDVFAIIVSAVLGLLTLSKAFVIIVVGFILYSIICLIIRFKLKSILLCGVVVLILGVFSFAFKTYLSDIFSRFTLYFEDQSMLSQITTGRSGIWADYIDEIFSTPQKAMFGVGLFTTDFYSAGPHNSGIFLLYRFGVVGVILIFVLIASYIRGGKPWFKIRFNNCLMFLTWLFLALEEVVISDKFLIFLLFALIIMFKEQADPEGYRKVVEESQKQEMLKISKKKTKNKNIEIKSEIVDLTSKDIVNSNQEDVSKTETKKYTIKSKKKLSKE